MMWRSSKAAWLAIAVLCLPPAAALGNAPRYYTPENDPANADYVSELPVEGALEAWRDRMGRLREAPAADPTRDATFCLESQWRDFNPADLPYGRVVNRCDVPIQLAWCTLDSECEATGGSMRVLEPNAAQRVSDHANPRYLAVACFGPVWPGGSRGLSQGFFCAESNAPRGRLRAARASQLGSLAQQCATERLAAGQAVFGGTANEFQLNQVDDRLHNEGWLGQGVDELKEAWSGRALAEDSEEAEPLSAPDAYVQCLLQARIQELDPTADFDAILASERQEMILASMPRREAGAGASMLRDSLDPSARAAREAAIQQARAQSEADRRRREAESREFWAGVMQVGAVALQSYVDYELAQAQAEYAQAQAQALAQERARQAQAMAQSQARATTQSQQRAASSGPTASQQGRQQMLNPQTGQPCVTIVGRDRRDVPYYIEHGVTFANSCAGNASIRLQEVRQTGGTRETSGVVYGNGQHRFHCLEHKESLSPNGCLGFSDYVISMN